MIIIEGNNLVFMCMKTKEKIIKSGGVGWTGILKGIFRIILPEIS